MSASLRIAGLLGPTLMVMTASEFPLVQPHLYDQQIPPVVYLSGLLMFIGGLAIVRWHNRWRCDWTLVVTVCGWLLLALGVVRMFAASGYQTASAATRPVAFMVVEAILFATGGYLTWNAYLRRPAV